MPHSQSPVKDAFGSLRIPLHPRLPPLSLRISWGSSCFSLKCPCSPCSHSRQPSAWTGHQPCPGLSLSSENLSWVPRNLWVSVLGQGRPDGLGTAVRWSHTHRTVFVPGHLFVSRPRAGGHSSYSSTKNKCSGHLTELESLLTPNSSFNPFPSHSWSPVPSS